MPKPIQSKSTFTMGRRQLLVTAAVISTSGILPKTEHAEAVETAAATLVPTEPGLEVAPLNVCAVTAQRIAVIAARNRIRQEACLPLLSIPQELRRMKEAANKAQFEVFAHIHRDAVWAEVLATKRKAIGEPIWRPSSWMDGLGLQARVNKVLHRRFVQIGAAKASPA
jgi:hypothetical protein